MENQRKKGNPWTSPLPKPHKSLICVFGDALVLLTQNCLASGINSVMKFHDRDRDQSLVSHNRSWRQPSPPGNRKLLGLFSDLTSLEEFPNLKSNSNSIPQSCRGSPAGWDRVRNKPNTQYSLATGLIKLFDRMGRWQKNHSSPHNQPHKHSYVDVLQTAMENRGNSSRDSRSVLGHQGFNAGGNRVGLAGAFVCPPFQRQFPVRGVPLFQGPRGGGRRFDQHDLRGRGFDSLNRF
jgi:hypothetical protein